MSMTSRYFRICHLLDRVTYFRGLENNITVTELLTQILSLNVWIQGAQYNTEEEK